MAYQSSAFRALMRFGGAARNWWLVARWSSFLLPIGYLWFRLFDSLSSEWRTNPQYSYGWVVPVLCVGLLVRRIGGGVEAGRGTEIAGQSSEADFRHLSSVLYLFVFLAFLYLPTRLVEAATPEWRPIEWSLGFEAVGLTLSAIYLLRGREAMLAMAFPIGFTLVAIPWPTLVETPVIQFLSRINSALATEVVGCLGIPAIQHGNTIEVSTGIVGINDACSGIRSFQTSIMISLFFGELYRMSVLRRLFLLPAGLILAMGFNVCRMSILTVVAERKGIDAISRYHDPAGIGITILCTAGLWALALVVRPYSSDADTRSFAPVRQSTNAGHLNRFAVGLIIWLLCVEAGVEVWYRIRESHLKPSPDWSFTLPTANPTMKRLPIDPKTSNLLRFDEGEEAVWKEPDGSRWQAFYCNWRPGRVAGYLAKRHTPEICLPATGLRMVAGPKLNILLIKGLSLPVRSYVFELNGRRLSVFQCRWEAGLDVNSYVEHESARYNLVRSIWTGRGNQGQKVFEIIVSGLSDSQSAEAALGKELDKLLLIRGTRRGPG